MIDFDFAYNEFKKYINQFDLKYGKNDLKVRHTLGVVKCSEYISKELKLSDEEIELAKVIALLHDIGRFEQIRLYDDFRDNVGDDHAKLGCKILFDDNLIRNFIKDGNYDMVIFKAISNHNKYEIEDGLNQRELLHAKIIRDADKTDNFRVKSEDNFENIIDNSSREKLENGIITEKIYNDFMQSKLILITDRKTDIDFWVSFLAFIFDFNFEPGLKYIYEHDYINQIIDRLDYKIYDTKNKMEKIRGHALSYVKSRIS